MSRLLLSESNDVLGTGSHGLTRAQPSSRFDVHVGELVRRRGVIAKTTTEEDAMHPTIIKALADERIADRTRPTRAAASTRRLRSRLSLVWANR